jgi:DNA gyrase subunit A
MRMPKDDYVIAMNLVAERATMLAVSERGYGKRTLMSEYNTQKRGGQGVFTLKTGERNGAMISILQVIDDDQVMLMTDSGRLVRIRMNSVSVIGRNTQGVTLIGCADDERVIGAVRAIEKQDDDDLDDDLDNDQVNIEDEGES